MPLVLQQYIVMLSKYSKFGVDTFNTFLHDNHNNDNDNLAITIARLFLSDRQDNKQSQNFEISDMGKCSIFQHKQTYCITKVKQHEVLLNVNKYSKKGKKKVKK